MDDKQSETRKRYLAGWQARMNHHEVDGKQREIRERYLGIGVALGAGLGVARREPDSQPRSAVVRLTRNDSDPPAIFV